MNRRAPAIARPSHGIVVGLITFMSLIALTASGAGDAMAQRADVTRPEAGIEPFLGEARMTVTDLFSDERFPNVVVALDGTIVATWGSNRVRVRRSEDGGETWGPGIAVGEGIHGGGVIVDERSGDLLLFTHPEHPPRDGVPAARTLYRSSDHGKSWAESDADFRPDAGGYLPSLHMMEHGTTLVREEHAGRLIRTARVYRRSPERYCDTIYSDDGGKTWLAGEPFPVKGTGEAALVELSGGRLLASTRYSFFPENETLRSERLHAYSDDGGVSWHDPFFSDAVPDGPRYRGTDRRGANYNGHFGLFGGLCRLPVAGHDVLITSNADHDGHERVRLTVWASFDGGRSWPVKRLVHEGPSAYSSLTAGRPGTAGEGQIYLQYEFGEGDRQYVGCKLARFNLSWLLDGESTGDGEVPERIAEGR